MLPPNWFKKKKIEENVPIEFLKIIKKTKQQSSKIKSIKYAYSALSKIYYGGNLNTISRFMKMYKCDIENISKEKGFMHCTKLNYLLRFILIKSTKFKDEDIKQKLSWCGYFFPHQYLQIKMGKEKYINVDLWGKRYGIEFGDYVKTFPKRI